MTTNTDDSSTLHPRNVRAWFGEQPATLVGCAVCHSLGPSCSESRHRYSPASPEWAVVRVWPDGEHRVEGYAPSKAFAVAACATGNLRGLYLA